MEINSVDGHRNLSQWRTGECSALNGTDGFSWPPDFQGLNQSVYLYNPVMCRSMPLEPSYDVMVDGVPAVR